MSSIPSEYEENPYEESYLVLQGGRTLAYAETGSSTSSEVVIMFHGVFGIGALYRWHNIFEDKSKVLQSDWGRFDPQTLDEEHAKKLIFIVMTNEDKQNTTIGEWLLANLKNAQGRYEEGGHMASLFVMDDILTDWLTRSSTAAFSATS